MNKKILFLGIFVVLLIGMFLFKDIIFTIVVPESTSIYGMTFKEYNFNVNTYVPSSMHLCPSEQSCCSGEHVGCGGSYYNGAKVLSGDYCQYSDTWSMGSGQEIGIVYIYSYVSEFPTRCFSNKYDLIILEIYCIDSNHAKQVFGIAEIDYNGIFEKTVFQDNVPEGCYNVNIDWKLKSSTSIPSGQGRSEVKGYLKIGIAPRTFNKKIYTENINGETKIIT